ncbi:MAG: DNRLRE domain-containing protein [Actinomycetota bacterium]
MLLGLLPTSVVAATGPSESAAESDGPTGATTRQNQAPQPEGVQARIADELESIPTENLDVPEIAASPADPAQTVGPPPVASVEQADRDWDPGREIASRRTATSRTFTGRVPGELETRVFPVAVHYRRGGRWEAIDSTIQAVGDDKRQSRANSFAVRLSERADDPFLAELQIDAEHSVAFGLQGAAQSEGRVHGRLIDYSGVALDTDLRLISTNSGIKEEIILRSPKARHRFVFPLKLKGLSASIDEQGDVVYSDSKGRELARTPAGYMYDSALDRLSDEPAYSDGVTYNLIRRGSQVALEVTLDSDWILSKERVWPIVVDPQIQRGAWVDDTYVMSPYNNNYSADTELKVGTFNGGGNAARSFMHFDTGSLEGVVTYAELQMRETHSYSCSAPPEAIFRVTQGWVGSTTRTFPGPSYDPSGTLGWWVSGSCGSRLAAWNVTGMVQHFQNIAETMGSFAAVATQETNSYQWKKYRSTQASDGPMLKIYTNYPPGTPNPVTPAAGERVYASAVPVSARYHDAEGTPGYIAFGVWDAAGTLRWSQWSALMNSGATAIATTSALPDGTYRISTVAWDGQFYSAWSPDQWFSVDTVPPNPPTTLTPVNNATVGTVFTASASYAEPTGRAGQILFWVNTKPTLST